MKLKKAKFFMCVFLVLSIIFIIGSLIVASYGDNFPLGYKASAFIGIGSFGCAFICLFPMFHFLTKMGGTVKHQGWITTGEVPPKIVNPTLSTTVLCPFECTCEKHYGAPHDGIDIAPQTPGVEGDPVFAVTKGKVYIDEIPGTIKLVCKMFTITYRDLATITCENGAKVKAGDTIGTMGGSKTIEGVQLHIEFWHNDCKVYVDPLIYYDWDVEKEELEKEKYKV